MDHTEYTKRGGGIQQGVSWFTRTAISYATITLQVHQYADSEDSKVQHIDADQIVTGGIKGTSEARTSDWTARPHTDHIFGTVEGRTRLVRGAKGADGKVRPNLEVNVKVDKEADDAKIKKFLQGEILADGSETEGFVVEELGEEIGEGEGLWVQNYVVNQDEGYGWSAEQVCFPSIPRGPGGGLAELTGI